MDLKALINKKLNTSSNPKNETEAVQIAMPFILKGAKRWTRNHLSYMDDFIMQGVEGALIAYKKYKGTEFEEKGYKYSSYAYMWIRAQQQEYAGKLWKYKNNTATIPDNWDGGDSYEFDEEDIDKKRAFERLDKDQRRVVELRTKGYTFEEISSECGYKNLHEARKEYLKAVGELS